MAKTRKISNALIRVFDQSSSIVYLVTDEFKIGYANEACAQWLDQDLESIIGAQLIYSSQTLEDPTEHAVKGLSIAPHIVNELKRQDSFAIEIFNESAARDATAFAIYDHRIVFSGLLVVGSASDRSDHSPDVRGAIAEPAKLHEALAFVRLAHGKRFNQKRLVGNSAAADRIRRQVRSASESDSDVLVVGPTGSGREHIARTIFESSFGSPASPGDLKSGINDSRLVPLHCSITDPALIQSTMKELLSHKAGRATLLLIDVDLMDAGSQQELLGYLQLPGLAARMIATSSTRLLDSGLAFDQTLASRLSTFSIEIPALAERREDLPLLAQAILESKNDQQARQYSGFTEQAIELICEYDWPGNFGQLATAIEEAAANATGPVVQAADFSDTFHHSIKAQQFAAQAETKIQLEQYLLGIEQRLVQRAIAEAKGNKTKAAELLGISRAKLLRRIAVFEKPDADETVELVDPSVFKEEGTVDDH